MSSSVSHYSAAGVSPLRRFAAEWMAAIGEWRVRNRQRAELASLADSGFDFGDMGLTRAFVETERRKWPWQRWGD